MLTYLNKINRKGTSSGKLSVLLAVFKFLLKALEEHPCPLLGRKALRRMLRNRTWQDSYSALLPHLLGYQQLDLDGKNSFDSLTRGSSPKHREPEIFDVCLHERICSLRHMSGGVACTVTGSY